MGRKLTLFLLLFFLVFSILPLTVRTEDPPEQGSFGNPTIPTPKNWSRFWQLFNAYSDWDLEYNNGSGWISDKSQLQIIKNYTERIEVEGGIYKYFPINKTYADSCKITLNFTASYTADYRLTFAINLDVKKYTHKEGSWNYTISYQNHTVYFDWTDIKNLPLDNVAHGIQPVGDDSFFWFRIRKNNIQQGTNFVVDPLFGYDTVGGTARVRLNDAVVICKFTAPEAGTLVNLTMYLEHGGAGDLHGRGIVYDDVAGVPTNLVDSGDQVDVPPNGSPAWGILSGMSYSFANAEVLWLGIHTSQTIRYWQDAGGANQHDRSAGLDEYDDGTDNPWGVAHDYQAWKISVYANYTVAGGQDLTFNLFENFNIWGSFSRSLVLSRSLFENVQFYSSSVGGREWGFSLFENVMFYASSSRGIEIGRSLFEAVRMWSSVTSSFQISGLNLAFILFENFLFWGSLATVIEGGRIVVTVTETVTPGATKIGGRVIIIGGLGIAFFAIVLVIVMRGRH